VYCQYLVALKTQCCKEEHQQWLSSMAPQVFEYLPWLPRRNSYWEKTNGPNGMFIRRCSVVPDTVTKNRLRRASEKSLQPTILSDSQTCQHKYFMCVSREKLVYLKNTLVTDSTASDPRGQPVCIHCAARQKDLQPKVASTYFLSDNRKP
jgi:hypothetical protein